MVKHIPIILASSSIYRKKQLQSLRLAFTVSKPAIDESVKPNELPEHLTARLAIEKAEKIKADFPTAVVIGSDQVCTFKDQIYGKPGSEENAAKQLQAFSNNCIEFFTALCVLSNTSPPLVYVDKTTVKFRALTQSEIKRYIEVEQPLDCAGSFKVESLGLSLFESVTSNDPSALLGLPLIKLCEFLRTIGYELP